MALDGSVLTRLARLTHTQYGSLPYAATMVAVAEVEQGGSDNVWVADGYDASLVHRYSADGELLQTLDGTDEAGLFNCPHGIFIDYRGAELELLVADRSNNRGQIFDLEGKFKRILAKDF